MVFAVITPTRRAAAEPSTLQATPGKIRRGFAGLVYLAGALESADD